MNWIFYVFSGTCLIAFLAEGGKLLINRKKIRQTKATIVDMV